MSPFDADAWKSIVVSESARELACDIVNRNVSVCAEDNHAGACDAATAVIGRSLAAVTAEKDAAVEMLRASEARAYGLERERDSFKESWRNANHKYSDLHARLATVTAERDALSAIAGSGEAAATIRVTVLRLAEEIIDERLRQAERYPDSEHLLDGTGGSGRKTWERIAKQSCDRATREGRLTHTEVFEEETAEVMATANPAELRNELIQVAAVCCKWIADIDSRTTAASGGGRT